MKELQIETRIPGNNPLEKFSEVICSLDFPDFYEVMVSEEKLKDLVSALGFNELGCDYFNKYTRSLNLFARNHQSLLRDFLNGKTYELTPVIKKFIDCIIENQIFLNTDFEYCPDVFPFICSLMSRKASDRQPKNYFEFGLGSGEDAIAFKKLLLKSNPSLVVNLFGYDPNSDSKEGLSYLIPNQMPNLKFDLFLAKWALHHVPTNQRWHDLSVFLKHCADDALIIFVEEGIFVQDTNGNPDIRKYELLHAISDALINVSFEAQTFQNNFFISYLKASDLHRIEQSFPFSYKKSVFNIGHQFFSQTVICYDKANIV